MKLRIVCVQRGEWRVYRGEELLGAGETRALAVAAMRSARRGGR